MFPLNTKRNKMDPYSEEAIAIVEAKRAEREANRAAREATLEAKQAKQARREEKAAAAQSLQEELKERKKSYVCCLCPDTSRTSLVKLGKPTAKKSNSTMRKPAAAHKVRASFPSFDRVLISYFTSSSA